MRTVTFPLLAHCPQHSSGWNGPAYLQGTWEDTGKPQPIISLSGAVAFWGPYVWICGGGSKWAFVADDGQIQGFVHYTMPREGFTVAERVDVQLIQPVPMVSLPPQQPIGTFKGAPLTPGPATVEYHPPSRWNGVCPRCGKGTYTGAWDVEHEDGGCP